ncbi:MAG: helix-turn-helix transcriptional regulator [Chloroflexi bacterium]|nr:helix-turn-helix transcriptional regulator [Chloroflexota bacterium]
MQDVFYIETVEQATTLLKPQRIELLKRMGEPRTCPELAGFFGQTPQKIYYHVKELEKAGLVVKTDEQRVRGVVEGYYQAKARSYWLAPHLVGRLGGERPAKDQASLRFLLTLAEEIHDDVGRLANKIEANQDVPSLALSAHIHLPNGRRRAEFLQEVQTFFQDLARKYGLPDETAPDENADFRVVLGCYPK